MQGHLTDTQAKGRKSVINSRGEERWHRNNPSLTSSLYTQWIQRRWRLDMVNSDGWNLGCRRDQVIHEAGINKLSLFIKC